MSNFLLSKMNIEAILRKDNCLAAIRDNGKWNEMDNNMITDLQLAQTDGV